MKVNLNMKFVEFKNYSPITLTPRDITDRKLFQKFKVIEMRTSVLIYSIFQIAVWIFNLMNLIVSPSKPALVNVLIATMGLAFMIVVFLISKRWTDGYVYLLPVHRLIVSGIFLLTLPELNTIAGECSFETQKQLLIEAIYFILGFIIDITMLSPSLMFTALIYGPIYAFTHLISMY